MRKGYAITDHGDETYTLKMNGSIVSTFAYSSISMSPSSPMFAAGDSALWYIIPAGVTRTFEFSLDELIPSQTGDYSWELNSLSVATAMDSNTLSRINLGPEFETGTLHLNANVPEPSTWTLLVCGLSTLALRRKR
ncbi:MAG: PEP-CTERM sorting domain-containing protein [bacterium]